MPFEWSEMQAGDLGAVTEIAAEVHRGFPEDDEVFAERLRLYPEGCRLLRMDDMIAGYVLSHPWPLGQLPMLNSLLQTIPIEADSYYIHDMALSPVAQGTGAARAAVAQLASRAREHGFATMSLVAVNSSQGFWARQGFEVVQRPELAAKLRSYERAARFMVRQLA